MLSATEQSFEVLQFCGLPSLAEKETTMLWHWQHLSVELGKPVTGCHWLSAVNRHKCQQDYLVARVGPALSGSSLGSGWKQIWCGKWYPVLS